MNEFVSQSKTQSITVNLGSSELYRDVSLEYEHFQTSSSVHLLYMQLYFKLIDIFYDI